MRPQSYGVLRYIGENGPCSFGDLYANLTYTESSIYRSVDELIGADMIDVSVDPDGVQKFAISDIGRLKVGTFGSLEKTAAKAKAERENRYLKEALF